MKNEIPWDFDQKAWDLGTGHRNPNRIKIIIDMLQEFWSKNPDYRFGQVMANFLLANNIENLGELYRLEDEDFFIKFKKYAK